MMRALGGLGYTFVYFDGVNRFYLSGAHPELRRHAGPGPNVFDGFVLSGRASSMFCSNLLADDGAAQLQAAELIRAAEAKAADLVKATEERAAARCADLRNAIAVLEESNAATAKALGWCRKELRTQRRKVWREQVQRREAEASHADLGRRLNAVHAVAGALETRLHETLRAADTTRRELVAVQASWSWRLTAPLRWTAQSLRACVTHGAYGWRAVGALGQRLGTLAVEGGLSLVRRRPRLKRGLLLAIGLVPGLAEQVTRLSLARSGVARAAGAPGAPARTRSPAASFDIDTLPRSARRAYRQLAAARAAQAVS